jgi:hypothetical protein
MLWNETLNQLRSKTFKLYTRKDKTRKTTASCYKTLLKVIKKHFLEKGKYN